MKLTGPECFEIEHSNQPGSCPPAQIPRSADIVVLADGLALPATSRWPGAPRHRLRGHLIVIGFVAAAPVAIGGWLWLLGRAAFALL
jgi:hypothetical protein